MAPPAGEMETDEDLPSENEHSSPSEDSVSAGTELENGLQKKRLFTLHFNNMGKSDCIRGEVRFDEDHMQLSGALLYTTTAQRESHLRQLTCSSFLMQIVAVCPWTGSRTSRGSSSTKPRLR